MAPASSPTHFARTRWAFWRRSISRRGAASRPRSSGRDLARLTTRCCGSGRQRCFQRRGSSAYGNRRRACRCCLARGDSGQGGRDWRRRGGAGVFGVAGADERASGRCAENRRQRAGSQLRRCGDRKCCPTCAHALTAAAADHGAWMTPIPIAHHGGRMDVDTLRELLAGLGDTDGGASLETPQLVIERVGECRVVVTGSYHGAVFALAQGIPGRRAGQIAVLRQQDGWPARPVRNRVRARASRRGQRVRAYSRRDRSRVGGGRTRARTVAAGGSRTD